MGLSDKEALEIYKKALMAARKMGFEDLAEDLAQEVVMQAHLKPDMSRQYISRRVYDAYRKYKSQKHFLFSLATEKQLKKVNDISSQNALPDEKLNFDLIYEKLTNSFALVERIIFILKYKWQFNLLEIAECFGKTEAWASQEVSKIEESLKETIT